MRDGEIYPVVRPEGGSSSLTCVGKLALREQASNTQRRARGHRGKRKREKEVRQMASENFLKHFFLPRGVGFCCERCHRAQSMSVATPESQPEPGVAGSPQECESVCEKHTIWKRAPAGHHYYRPDNTHDQEEQHTCTECHIRVYNRIRIFVCACFKAHYHLKVWTQLLIIFIFHILE